MVKRSAQARRKRARQPDQERLSKMLRDARMKSGVHQADLATMLGRPQSFVSNYETGERSLGFLDVRDVCDALGLPFESFVRRYMRDAEE